MEDNQIAVQQTPEDQQLARSYRFQVWKDRIYRLFYNIWPVVTRTLTGFFYLMFRIIRGFFRTAMEEIRHGG